MFTGRLIIIRIGGVDMNIDRAMAILAAARAYR
jgi:hypothetical protein